MSRALEPVGFDSGGVRLSAVLHGKGDGPVALLCEPFAEESKCARRVLTEAAWALVDCGVRVLRFDYRGCGDSGGDFESFDLQAWREDLRRAVRWVREELAPPRLALMGVRLGAALAAEAAPDTEPEALVLIAPILDGRAYWHENFRRTLIKARMTAGDGVSAEELRAEEQEEYFDLAGWLVPRTMREQLEQVSLPLAAAKPVFTGPCLVVDVSARTEPAAPMVHLAEAYPAGEVRAIRLEPFWQRIGLVDAAPLAEVLAGWLAVALGPAREEAS